MTGQWEQSGWGTPSGGVPHGAPAGDGWATGAPAGGPGAPVPGFGGAPGPGFGGVPGPGFGGVPGPGFGVVPQFGPGRGTAQPGGDRPPTSPVFAAPPSLSLGRAFAAGFNRVNGNLGPWLMIPVAPIAVAFLLGLVASSTVWDELNRWVRGEMPSTPAFFGSVFLLFVAFIVIGTAPYFGELFMVRGSLEEADGRRPKVGDFFRIAGWPGIFGTTLVLLLLGGVMSFIGVILLPIPVIGVLLFIALGAALLPVNLLLPAISIDRRTGPVGAWRVLREALRGRYLPTVGSLFLIHLFMHSGLLLCFIGVAYTWPVGIMAYVHLMRQITGGRRNP